MTKVSTKNVQRKISAEDLQFAGYLRAPMAAKPTAIGLWLHTDGLGRREVVPELLAAAIYPGEAATELIINHLLMLDESGFLDFYQDDGIEYLALRRPLKLDARLAWSNCPDPPVRESSRTFAAVGGARERAGERVRAEQAERAGRWATWADEQEHRTRPPERPLLLDAPPIGCPDHPHGAFRDCGPCGTARRRHDRWVREARYGEQMTEYEKTQAEEQWDDEPF